MAIGTAAAIATGVSLAATAASMGGSFAQAAKQKKAQREANAAAEKAIGEAEKMLGVNYYKGLSIQKEPYELEREANLVSGAQAIEAGVESERGAAATAGRVQMAQQAGQRQIAAAMGQEMAGLEKLTAEEESRLRDAKAQIELQRAAGAKQAAADAAKAAAQATQQGMQSAISMGSQIAQTVPLYAKTAGVKAENQFNKMAEGGKLAPQFYENGDLSKPMDFQKAIAMVPGYADVGKLKSLEFTDWLNKQQNINDILKQISSTQPTAGGFSQGPTITSTPVAVGGIPYQNMAGVGGIGAFSQYLPSYTSTVNQ